MDVDSGIFMLRLRRISRSKASHPKQHPFTPTLASSNVNSETDYQEQLPQQNLQFLYRSFDYLYMKKSTKERIRSELIGRILRLNRKDGANPNMKEDSCFEIDSDKTIDPRN